VGYYFNNVWQQNSCQKGEKKMKTIDIKGKAYIEVNERIKHFRENYKGYSLISELVSNENGVCIFKASVLNENREEVATGYAYEKEGSSFINKTSYIENCETSAWGRALGNFGIGIDTSIASADEVVNAIANQNTPKKASKSDPLSLFKLLVKDRPDADHLIENFENLKTDEERRNYYGQIAGENKK